MKKYNIHVPETNHRRVHLRECGPVAQQGHLKNNKETMSMANNNNEVIVGLIDP